MLEQEHEPAPAEIRELIVPRATFRAVIDHLRAWLPFEGCGLFATVDKGDARRVAHWQPGDNIDRSATRFTMDPAQVFAAVKANRAHGWSMGAIVHSHPRTPPIPSETDLREAYYQHALLAIVSFAADEPELRVWDVRGASTPAAAREVTARIVASLTDP